MRAKTGVYIGYLQFHQDIIDYAFNNDLIKNKIEINPTIDLPSISHMQQLDLLIGLDDAQWNDENVKYISDKVDDIIVKNAEVVPRCVLRSSTRVHLVDNNVTTHGGLEDASITKIEEIHEQQQLEKDILREHRGGRPPVGTEVEDGYLVKSDEYRAVRRMLEQYRENAVSASGAAEALDTSVKTISNASQRTELYQLG